VGGNLCTFAREAGVQILNGKFVITAARSIQEAQYSASGRGAAKRVLGNFGLSDGGSGGRVGNDELRRGREANQKSQGK
jgi:hypothetical protein